MGAVGRARPRIWASAIVLATFITSSALAGCDDAKQRAVPTTPSLVEQSPSDSTPPTLSPPPVTPAVVDRVLGDPKSDLIGSSVSAAGEVLTLWSGDCKTKGRRCREVYVLRDAEGVRASFAMPRGPRYALPVASDDGFVLQHYDVAGNSSGKIVRPDGELVTWQVSGSHAQPVSDAVALLFAKRRALLLDVNTAEGRPGVAVPADWIDSVTLDEKGQVWALAVRNNQYVLARSRDGRSSWAIHVLPVGLQGRVYPNLVVSSDGHAAVLTRFFAPTGPGPALERLTVTSDGGGTWSDFVRADLPFGFVMCSATAGGRLLVVDNHVHLWRSNDDWTSFRQVRDAPGLYLLAAAGQYVLSEGDDPSHLQLSDDGGLTWTTISAR
jgi:hypothetical protein